MNSTIGKSYLLHNTSLQRVLLAKAHKNAAQLPEFVIHFVRGAHRLHHLLSHGAGELPAQPMDMRFDRAHRQSHSLRNILV